MKIAMINPCSRRAEIMHKCPPYGILSLIAYLRQQLGDLIEIKYFDDFLETDIKESVKIFDPDIVGISSTTPTIKRAYELADYFKQHLGCLLVLGGKHPSSRPQESSAHADHVVVGEGEIALLELIKARLENKMMPPQVIVSEEIKDLDTIPPTPWDLIDKDYYLSGKDTIGSVVGFDKVGKSIGLLTSRGCPFKCIFCYNSHRFSRVRYFSPERVILEIEFMLKNWNVDSIFFFDDEFLSHKPRIRKICELIREKNLKFKWTCEARADIIDAGILDLIKSCGCIQVNYGFESGSPKILKFLKGEKASLEKNIKAIHLTRKSGLRVYGNIILGTPTESYLDFIRTFYFALMNPIDIVATSIATAYPGTELWDYCIENKIFDENSVDYERLSLLRGTLYLNEKHIPKKVFYLLFLFYSFIFLFKRGLSFPEILLKVGDKIFKKNPVKIEQ